MSTTLILRPPLHDGCRPRRMSEYDILFDRQSPKSYSKYSSKNALGPLDGCVISSFSGLNLHRSNYSLSPSPISCTSTYVCYDELKDVCAASEKEETRVEDGRYIIPIRCRKYIWQM